MPSEMERMVITGKELAGLDGNLVFSVKEDQ